MRPVPPKKLTCSFCGTEFYRKTVDKRWSNYCCSRACQDRFTSQMMTRDRAERFWARVTKGGLRECWLWQGRISADGYGCFAWKHSHQMSAHRAAYLLTHSLTPKDLTRHDSICHKCDVRACVNPHHLWLGNAHENNLDAHRKGRYPVRRGERHHNAKLTDDQVRAIRRDDRPPDIIAADHGVTPGLIYQVRKGLIWTHVA